MKIRNLVWILAMTAVVLCMAVGCGGGSDTIEIEPPLPNPDDNSMGGDPSEISPIGVPQGQFTIPGGFDDLRGIAVSQEYVYIGTATTLFAFDRNGNYVNAVAAPNTIQAVDVFPPQAEVDLPVEVDYFLAGFPIIAHNPIPLIGYLRIYGPNLDTMTTREDAGHNDGAKFIALPDGQVNPPMTSPPAWQNVTAVYDMQLDRFGSILVTVDLDNVLTDTSPDYPRGLQILNIFDSNFIEYGASRPAGIDPVEYWAGDGVACYHRSLGHATGDQGTFGIDTFFPFNRTEMRYTLYAGHFNLLRDYVGVSFVELNPATLSYVMGAAIPNSFSFNRVIGESVGNAPGSFSQNPPVNLDGGLEDPDLTNGGASGFGVDPTTDNIYICDPGNRRVQVFDQDTGDFLFLIGDGLRGRSGNSFLAPSEATVDLEGNVYICDVTDVRVLRGSYPDRQFGGVGGTVYNGQLNTPLEGVSITLGNELGALALNTSNINGDYLFNNMLVGTYYLTASKFNFDSDTTPIQILSDRMVRADFLLMPNEPATVGAYTGTVIDDETNGFLSDVRVLLVGTSIETVTDGIGRFQLNNIRPGTYQVVFMLDDYETITRDLEIFAGQTSKDPLIKLQPIL